MAALIELHPLLVPTVTRRDQGTSLLPLDRVSDSQCGQDEQHVGDCEAVTRSGSRVALCTRLARRSLVALPTSVATRTLFSLVVHSHPSRCPTTSTSVVAIR